MRRRFNSQASTSAAATAASASRPVEASISGTDDEPPEDPVLPVVSDELPPQPYQKLHQLLLCAAALSGVRGVMNAARASFEARAYITICPFKIRTVL